MKERHRKKTQVLDLGKRGLAFMMSLILLLTSADLTAFAYEAEKSEYLSAVDKDGNEIVTEDESWEETFPNGTFAFKNEYINIEESPEPETQKITLYRLGGTAGEATAKIAVTPVVSYLDEEGTQAIYANAASNLDYTLAVEDPIGTSEDGETTYSQVELNQENIYGASYFDITFAEGEWVKDILVTPVDDEEHESQELALLTIYDVEGAEFTETANRTTISIADDEEVLPSEMGFEAETIRVDKSEQKAVVRVTRTGAIQYVSAVEFQTEDGTAVAGKDYVKTEGTASFSGDIDYYDIEVDLIDDKQVSEEDVSFRILLSDPKGGSILEGKDSIQVDLYNSSTSEDDNLATRLQSPDAVDLTTQVTTEEKAITEHDNQVVTEPDTSLEETTEGTYVLAEEGGKKARSIASAGELQLDANAGSWKQTQTNPEDVGTWTFSGGMTRKEDGAVLSTDYDEYMSLEIPGIANRFSSLKWKVKCKTYKHVWWAKNYLSATYGALATSEFSFKDSGEMGETGDDGMRDWLNSVQSKYRDELYNGTFLFRYMGNDAKDEKTTEGTISITDGKYDHLVFKIRGTDHDGKRRDREGKIDFNSFTMERRALKNNPVVSVITPDDDDGLAQNLNNIKPVISMTSDAGTNSSGKLYYGSSLRISENDKSGRYALIQADLTKGNGSILWSEKKGTNGSATIQIADSDNINDRLEEDNLKLNTYLERSQRLEIFYGTSFLEGDTDADKQEKKNRVLGNITYKSKEFNESGRKFVDAQQKKLTGTDNSNATKMTTGYLKNVKSINFNLDDGTMILYNNQAYDGDMDIPISPDHYNSETLSFYVYTPDAVSVERDPQVTSISQITLFVDTNGNSTYDEGVDTKVRDIPSESLCMDEFRPIDGQQLWMAVSYNYAPACLQVPPGNDENATFSVVPSFVTALTEEAVKEKLSKEMQSYRDIESKDGTAKLYAESEGMVSVPLGYDASPAKFNEEKNCYEWTPEWKGNLLKNFANPEKIYLDDTWMPNGFEAASSKEEINQYLGCLQGNDTLVISSRKDGEVTAISQAGFSTYPEMGAQSFDQEDLDGITAPTDTGGVTANMPDAAETSPSIELPEIEIGISGLSYIMGSDEIGFSVGIPLIDQDDLESKDDSQDQLNQLKKAFNNRSVFEKLRERSHRYGPDHPGFEGGDMRGSSSVPSFELAVSATFMWKYNQKTASFEFSSAMMAVAVSGSVKLQYRFNSCPIFYVYLTMGGEVSLSTGLNVEVSVDENGNKKNHVEFAGLILEPSVFIEAGGGVGIDLAHLEVYVHVSVSMAVSLGEEGLSFDKFETGASVGFNAQFLFFSYKMDVIGCTGGYDKELTEDGGSGWYFYWSLCGRQMMKRTAKAAEGAETEEPEIPGAKAELSGPQDTSGSQEFYTSDDNAPKKISTFAFNLDGVPFQTSGYGSSTAAVKLAEGLDSASNYELLTVGDKNYLLYTISRSYNETGRDTDTTQIVLSELTTLSSDGDEVKGLANPVDPEAEVPYIILDYTDGKVDSLGDLEFHAYVKDGTITVTWISYTEDAYDNVVQTWSEEQLLAEISKHVCVKTASFTPGSDTRFSDSQVISGQQAENGYRFLPKVVNDEVIYYTEAEPYSEAKLEERAQAYKEYYAATAEGNLADGSGGTGDPYANVNYQYAVTLDELYGQYSKLNFAVKQEDGTYQQFTLEPSETWKAQGARIDYIRAMDAEDGSFYMAYATSEEQLAGEDRQTVKKLYLQKIQTQDGQLVPGTAVLIKTLVDSDQDDSLDGEYQGGALVEQVEAPNFNNLKFLNGKLTAGGEAETFFLFGMNGMTYIIDKENLDLFCSGQAGTISPFFTKEETGNSQSDTVIGVDGDGNISAVYTDSVPSTVNNALYVTKYDPTTESFGEGTMLAMNHMQVYEDAQAGNWGAEETEEAYYDPTKNGGMDKFTFQEPQIALGTPTSENKDGTLTIVTQGTYTELVRTTLQKPNSEETVEEVVPNMEHGISGEMGVYALTYGVGKQDIGEEAIQLNMEEFTPGNQLQASVSFRNTGDVAIRAAEGDDYAASVKLYAAKKDGTDAIELAGWKILSNVLAGQQVTTDTVTTRELPEDIADRVLYFTVGENTSYITEGAFLASTFDNEDGQGKIVVGNRAEVSISKAEVTAGQDLRRENINGQDSVVADLDLVLENGGVNAADNIRIQVERTDGKTETGEDNYVALDLDAPLVEYTESSSEEGQALTEAGDEGIYKVTGCVVENEDGTSSVQSASSIEAGESLHLTGKITLPVSCFDVESPREAINLRFTVLTDTKEYTDLNNTALFSFSPVTKFTVPQTISLTLGNTINFELPYITAAAKNSNISVTEMAVSATGEAQEASADEKLLEMLSYNPVNGMISVRAGKLGSGVIRVADTATNSYEDLVFSNTSDGTNISVENQALTFKNSANGQWEDRDIGKITEDAILPYNHDICIGRQNGSFTFTTYASSIELYFSGRVEVSSKNDFGFGSVIVEGSGKSRGEDYFEPQVIDFKNSALSKHEVTVTVLNETAEFDKIVEKYGTEGDLDDIVEKDTQSPVIRLGKKLPGTGKLQAGTVFELPIYIYDNMAINSVSIDGGGADTYLHQGFAQSVLRITQNRLYRIIVLDAFGNRASYDLDVDWFDTNVTVDTTKDTWPTIDAKVVNAEGEAITGFTNAAAYIQYQITAPQGVSSVRMYQYDPATDSSIPLGSAIEPGGAVTELDDVMKEALPQNGYYRIEVEDTLRNVTSAIFYWDCLSSGPEVNLYKSTNESGKLFYSAGSKTNEVALEGLAIYKGSVQQTSSDSIDVDGVEPVVRKDYSQGETVTWDTGTIELGDTSIYTIMARDAGGGIRTLVYSDYSTLDGLAVHDDAFELEMETFSPYQYEYHVTLPYEYPENQLPSVEYSISQEAIEAGATVTKTSGENSITVTMTYQGVDRNYVIYFEREVCTCGVELTAYDNDITIPYGQDTFTGTLDTRVKVLPCNVKEHKGQTEDDVQYSYEVLEGATYVDIAEDGAVTYHNFPRGSAQVTAKIQITASTATASDQAVANCIIRKGCLLHVETTHCGRITSGDAEDEDATVLPTEDGAKEMDVYLTGGEEYEFEAIVDEGCVFDGWMDENGQLIQKDAKISGTLLDNLNLRAVFRDVTPPTAEISLKAVEKPEEGEGKDEILYSKEGIEITVTGEDNESGVKSVQYQVVEAGNDYDEEKGWVEYTEPVVLEDDIFAVVYARVEDQDGNVTVVHSKEIMIDKEGGKLILTPNFTDGEWTRNEDAQIHVLATEGVSPIKRVTYIVDGKAYLREQNQFVIEDLQDGDYDVKVIAEDRAGHEITETIRVKKETEDPTIQVTGNPTELVREATLTAEVTTGVSGLKEILVNGERIEGNTYDLKESQNGTYVFTVISNGGGEASVTVEVTNMINKVEDIDVNQEEVSLAVGKTHQIEWKVLPENATYQQVTFTSSDESKATVDENGLVTALGEGEAVITVASVDNPSVKKDIVLDLFEEYCLKVSVDTGGTVEYNGEVLVSSEEGKEQTADVYLRKGTEYTLEAKAMEGYEFTGWEDAEGNQVQSEAQISGALQSDRTLYAQFRDNVAPEGKILLTELESPKEVQMFRTLAGQDETAVYSSRGYQVTIESSDVPSGVKKVEYQVLDAGTQLDESKGWVAYEEPFVLTEDSHVVVYARIEDQDGNVTLLHSQDIVIDHTGVSINTVTSFTPGVWNNNKDNQIQIEVAKNVTDISKISYWVDQEEFQSEEEAFVIAGLKDGDYEVRIVVEDAAGNQVEAVIPVKQDTSTPEIKITGNPQTLERKAVLQIEAEPGISGVGSIAVNGVNIEGTSYTAEKNGTYEITLTNQAGTSVTETVEVTKVIVGVEAIQTSTEHKMVSGETWKAQWQVTPENATYPEVTFASSDEKVASVAEDGTITAKKGGQAVITITAADNPQVTGQIVVKVQLPQIKVKGTSDQNVLLTWKGAAGAKQYVVFRANKKNGKYKKIATVKASAYRDKKAKKGKTYYYKVQAIGQAEEYNGELSTAVKVKACVKTPVNVKVIRSGKNYKIRWSKSAGAKSYVIYRSAKKSGGYKRIGTSRTNSYMDRQTNGKKKWYYKVKAIGKKTKWNSAMSKGVTYEKKVTLKKTTASAKGISGAIGVSWKKIAKATNYQIYRAESKWGIFTKIAETDKITAWTDENVETGKTYYYKVRAIAKTGKKIKSRGIYSKVVKAKAK